MSEVNEESLPIDCEHPKKPGCVWCFACGAKRAGPKPEPTLSVGSYAIGRGMDWPGEIVGVAIELHGLAVNDPEWVEGVKIAYGGGSWSGPAKYVTRLVEGLTERQARGFAQVLFLLGSRTGARFDQWLRHRIGAEDAKAVLAWLKASGVDVERFGGEKAGDGISAVIRSNVDRDPSYTPYCMRCAGLVRMKRTETPLLFRCSCGAVHDAREVSP